MDLCSIGRHRNNSDHSEGEDYSDHEDEMPSGECPRNERRIRLPEDPLPRLSESSRVADMFEQAQWCYVAHVDIFVCHRCAAPGHVCAS